MLPDAIGLRDRAAIFQEATQTHPTCWFCQFCGKAFGPLTHGGCWRKQGVVPDFWWLVAGEVAIGSEPRVACSM